LDCSFGLLDEKDQVVLRRVSVFAAAFTSAAAATVAGQAPLMPGEVAGTLARLADHNLLLVVPAPGGTRYRMLETIRQYGEERMAEVGERTGVGGRHLRWCLTTAARLDAARGRHQCRLRRGRRRPAGWARLGDRPTAAAGRRP
jgi:predicted ATPase